MSIDSISWLYIPKSFSGIAGSSVVGTIVQPPSLQIAEIRASKSLKYYVVVSGFPLWYSNFVTFSECKTLDRFLPEIP
jgi:hypothetical protein